jgi:hypothetical protein
MSRTRSEASVTWQQEQLRDARNRLRIWRVHTPRAGPLGPRPVLDKPTPPRVRPSTTGPLGHLLISHRLGQLTRPVTERSAHGRSLAADTTRITGSLRSQQTRRCHCPGGMIDMQSRDQARFERTFEFSKMGGRLFEQISQRPRSSTRFEHVDACSNVLNMRKLVRNVFTQVRRGLTARLMCATSNKSPIPYL